MGKQEEMIALIAEDVVNRLKAGAAVAAPEQTDPEPENKKGYNAANDKRLGAGIDLGGGVTAVARRYNNGTVKVAFEGLPKAVRVPMSLLVAFHGKSKEDLAGMLDPSRIPASAEKPVAETFNPQAEIDHLRASLGL